MRKTIFYGTLIAAIGLCVFLLLTKRERHLQPMSKSSAEEINESAEPTASTTASTGLNSMQAMWPNESNSNAVKQQKVEPLSNAVQNWSAQVHGSIQFFGRVVDENNQPVEGAAVEFVWAQFFPLPEGTPSTNVFSDRQGFFSFAGVIGSRLGVHVKKDGYYFVKSMNTESFNYSTLPGTTPFQPESNNPVIFHLRKRGPGADLIAANQNVKIPLDGVPVEVNLFNQGSGTIGRLKLSQTKPPYESWKKAVAWSFRMEISGGGFIEENDEFPFEAPESGYKSVVQLNFEAGQPSWKTAFRKNYYITTGNPPRYGHLTVQTDIMWGGALISYTVNPDGSRYLEPK